MKKGYPFEHEIEQFFLKIANQSPNLPIDKRTFRVPESGSIRGLKGDVLTNIPFLKKQLIIECKSRKIRTKKQTFYVKKEWLEKLIKESEEMDRIPIFMFSLKNVKKNRIWCLIRKKDLLFLFNLDNIEKKDSISLSKNKTYIINKFENYIFCDDWVLISLDLFKSFLLKIK